MKSVEARCNSFRYRMRLARFINPFVNVDRVSPFHTSRPSPRQVVLREGDNLKAMAGFLSSTVVRVDVLNDQAGGGVCITLEI